MQAHACGHGCSRVGRHAGGWLGSRACYRHTHVRTYTHTSIDACVRMCVHMCAPPARQATPPPISNRVPEACDKICNTSMLTHYGYSLLWFIVKYRAAFKKLVTESVCARMCAARGCRSGHAGACGQARMCIGLECKGGVWEERVDMGARPCLHADESESRRGFVGLWSEASRQAGEAFTGSPLAA